VSGQFTSWPSESGVLQHPFRGPQTWVRTLHIGQMLLSAPNQSALKFVLLDGSLTRLLLSASCDCHYHHLCVLSFFHFTSILSSRDIVRCCLRKLCSVTINTFRYIGAFNPASTAFPRASNPSPAQCVDRRGCGFHSGRQFCPYILFPR
jgi:hypothetical protein